MERVWTVHRSTVPSLDAQQRWDLAYQFLLQWQALAEPSAEPLTCHHQEDGHGDCGVCTCLDASSTTGSDD